MLLREGLRKQSFWMCAAVMIPIERRKVRNRRIFGRQVRFLPLLLVHQAQLSCGRRDK
jgi:hypothetical protein